MQTLRQAALALAATLTAAACAPAAPSAVPDTGEASLEVDQELIVVAAPRSGDSYYAERADDIFAFHLAFARAVEGRDAFLVLTDAEAYPRYVKALGVDRVAIVPQEDIWARDYSLSNTGNPVMFRYTAEGQGGRREGQREADHVQETLADALEQAGLSFGESDLLNDGGNFVDDYAGNVVVSRKFLRDNRLTEDAARAAIQRETGAQNVAFIEADEQGGLEHADGVVAFIEPGVLVVNSYPDDPDYARDLAADLRAGLPEVTIHTIIAPYDASDIYDERFGSACGLYTNMLVTPHRIYLPQFGIPEDAEALASVRGWTSKEVVPVKSDRVCAMGGGVRCMTWELRGTNAVRFRRWALQQG